MTVRRGWQKEDGKSFWESKSLSEGRKIKSLGEESFLEIESLSEERFRKIKSLSEESFRNRKSKWGSLRESKSQSEVSENESLSEVSEIESLSEESFRKI